MPRKNKSSIPPAPLASEPVRRRFLALAETLPEPICSQRNALWLALSLSPVWTPAQAALVQAAWKASRSGFASLAQCIASGPARKERLEDWLRGHPEVQSLSNEEIRERFNAENPDCQVGDDSSVRKSLAQIRERYWGSSMRGDLGK